MDLSVTFSRAWEQRSQGGGGGSGGGGNSSQITAGFGSPVGAAGLRLVLLGCVGSSDHVTCSTVFSWS